MKKTINGFRFDTDKAIVVGGYSKLGMSECWTEWHATLYRTPRVRRFFLAGSGGFMTRFMGRDRIFPLSEAKALEWAARYIGISSLKHFVRLQCKGGIKE